MGIQTTIRSCLIVSAVGIASAAIPTGASAVVIDDGFYELTINTTPSTVVNDTVVYDVGNAGAYNSSLTFGSKPENTYFAGMTDNTQQVTVTADYSSQYGPDAGPGTYGTGVTDGVAGRITFDIVGGIIGNAQSFSLDTQLNTAGGNLATYMLNGDLTGINGSIDNLGVMSFALPGRMVAFDGPIQGIIGAWNYPDGTTLDTFTTGTSSNPANGAITGEACTGSAGTYACTLVSASTLGPNWWIYGQPYYEVWNISLNRIGDVSSVPLPATAWLFGSGLIGLIGFIRRKTNN